MRRRRFLKVKKLIDSWSVPHFLFGTVLALCAITFVLPIGYMFFATVYLAIFWELLEMRFRLSEAPGNGSADVILALLGFGTAILLVDQASATFQTNSSLLVVTSVLFLSLNFFAWRARFEHDREFLG